MMLMWSVFDFGLLLCLFDADITRCLSACLMMDSPVWFGEVRWWGRSVYFKWLD